jgi:hypothetical protein
VSVVPGGPFPSRVPIDTQAIAEAEKRRKANRNVALVTEVAGLIILSVGLFILKPWIGIAILGVGVILIGVGWELS